MRLPLTLLCGALFVACSAKPASAQFTDPRLYDNAPVGTNEIQLEYAYARANASIDTSIVVLGAQVNLNQGLITYTRTFGLWNHTSWAQATVSPAGLEGSIRADNLSASTTGFGDLGFQFGFLLIGGPALNNQQFEAAKQKTTLGVSLSVSAPTGTYSADNLLNLGSNRWSFKPEIAWSRPFGKNQDWEFDAYANAYFFTDNTRYLGTDILHQQALAGIEGHLSYSLTNKTWVSLDSRYSFRGDTIVADADQNSSQKNFILGSEFNVDLTDKASLTFIYEQAVVHQNGPAIKGFGVEYSYTWGGH